MTKVSRGGSAKTVFLIDPSTNLVQSMDIYIRIREKGEWKRVAATASIEYNMPLPDGLFDVTPPPGTKVYDLRNELKDDNGAKP